MRSVFSRALILTGVLASTSALAEQPFRPELSTLGSVPAVTLPSQTLAKDISVAAADKRGAMQFAVRVASPHAMTDGSWSHGADGMSHWRLRVESAGAVSMSVHLTDVALPEGAEMYFYDHAGKIVQGPIRKANRKGEIWSPLVRGSDVVIDVRVPTAKAGAVKLKLADGFHGFRTFEQASMEKRGSCEVDAVCPVGDEWRKQIRSAALYTIDNTSLCTGQLVNNVSGNLQGLILTANHCGLEFDPAVGPTGDSVVVYWNYASPACASGELGDLTQNQAGGFLIQRYAASDTALFGLYASPPPAYNVYYGGLDANGAVPTAGVVIHHPNGEEKSISTIADGTVAQTTTIDGVDIESWAVTYSEGSTEQGSSGAALWNQDGHIIGVLSGGTASCDNPTGFDAFGRMDIAWDAGGDDAAALKSVLDPDNLCAKTIPGRNAAAGLATENCQVDDSIPGTTPPSGAVVITPAVAPAGSQMNYQFDLVNDDSMTMTDVSFDIVLPAGLEWIGAVARSSHCLDGVVEQSGNTIHVAGMSVWGHDTCSITGAFVGDVPDVYTFGIAADALTSNLGSNPEPIEAVLQVEAIDPALNSFIFAPSEGSVLTNEAVELTWSAPGANSCDAYGEWTGSRPITGSTSVSFVGTGEYTFRLICHTDVGAAERIVTIAVTGPGTTPTPTPTPTPSPTPTPTPSGTPTPTPSPTPTPTPPLDDHYLAEPAGGGSFGSGLLAVLAGLGFLRRRIAPTG
ncbi:trypsin-like peptidase domain-containing protein [Sinimarinibacterium sp. CAU 1509]|uniref:trypsin-like serine peptidase n=1 Tax=Sinimarinibacterium sp. CAU 1509 TaxID=2562283 RepID=UPI0010ABA910|nr:trypsin-like peptidase domain-containing protein [Sinimarinibacterium sp. CAU 1509]TJY57307.1 trypsin-like peptidase domain-containing protein [Sinimarinibacterium sp. CAU 1509]